tara:strand:+ start:353 stop:676 length:324 start_codon:yes stop_codon:yes gene_type:complete
MGKNASSSSNELKGGYGVIIGLTIIFLGQIVNLLVFFYSPSNEPTLEEFINHLTKLRLISMFVVLTSVTGLIITIQGLRDLLDELQKDRETIDDLVQYMLSSEINKK